MITSSCILAPEIVKLGHKLSLSAADCEDRCTADSALGEALVFGVPGVMGVRLLDDAGARRTGGCMSVLSEQSILMEVGEAARDDSTELFADRTASVPLLPICADI